MISSRIICGQLRLREVKTEIRTIMGARHNRAVYLLEM